MAIVFSSHDGKLVLLGWQSRCAVLATVPVMLGAVSAHWAYEWNFNNTNGGWEFPAFLAATALPCFLQGEDGSLSLGRAIKETPGRSGSVVARPQAHVG